MSREHPDFWMCYFQLRASALYDRTYLVSVAELTQKIVVV